MSISRDIIEEECDYLEDGFLYFFPRSKGGLSAGNLREIADFLDDANKEHQEAIDGYFRGTNHD